MNNRLLGKEYDPYLIDFSKKVSDIAGLAFNHNFSLPDQISINIYTQRVLRSILGHLLAADIREDMNTPVTNSPYHNILRKYVRDPTESAPEELNVYYWLYPSDIQMIILTSSLSNIKSREPIFSEFIKFYPLGFWVTWKQPEMKVNLQSLTKYRDLKISDNPEITISLKNIPRVDWPEHVSNDEMLLLNYNRAYVSRKKKRKII